MATRAVDNIRVDGNPPTDVEPAINSRVSASERVSADPPLDDTLPAAAEVQIPDDAPPPRKAPKIVEPDEGIDKLKAQLDAERRAKEDEQRRRQEAEAQAAAAHESATKARGEVQDTNLSLVKTAIASVTQSLEMGEANYAAALAANDYATAARLQREMAQNAAKLQKLEDGKAELERPRPAERPPSRPDSVEAFASQLSPASGAWVRQHPECATDKRMHSKMMAAHYDALAEGIAPETREYFAAIEARLYPQAAPDDRDDDPPPPPRRSQAPPSAPVSRAGPNGSTRTRTATLSPQEREMAGLMKMTDEEYAINREALRREGKLN